MACLSYSSRLWLLCWIFSFASAAAQDRPDAAEFQASVVKVNITPTESQWLLGYQARQSEGVHDSLYHKIVAMDDGHTQFFLISSDLGVVSPGFYDAVTEELERETGISASQVWWTVTHTHSAPEAGPPGIVAAMMPERYEHEPNPDYSRWVKELLIEGVKEAQSRLEPARLGIATGMSMANINRRALSVDGEASLGMNPDGPVDRQIGLIRLDQSDGTPLAFIANYAMHGTVLGGQNLLISGDAPGIVAEYVEEALGAPMLFINGAAGDIAPIYSVYPDVKSGRLMQFKVLLGDRIIKTNDYISSTTSNVSLSIDKFIIETELKDGQRWVDELSNYIRTTSTGSNMVRIPIGIVKLNEDVILWSAPLELFTEIATRVRNHSPFPYTFYFGYTNGWLGYLTTRQAFSEGGYEPGQVTPFTEAAEDDFARAMITYLQGLP